MPAAWRSGIDAAASVPTAAAHIAPPREAPRGFNAITVAYWVGALLVLFALAWILVDRWRDLGAAGVLGVSILYAVVFAVTSAVLRRRGFRTAGGLAASLAVSMTPVWVHAILRLTGEWPDPFRWGDPLLAYRPWMATRWIVLELATLGVALATIRRVSFFAIGAPMATAFVTLLLNVGEAFADPRTAWYTGPYYQLLVACVVLAVAYAIDRRQPRGEDYALWFYIAGVALLLVSYLMVWNSIGAWRHALPVAAAALVTASLYLRRRVLLVGGGLAAIGYLGYLALDVFRDVVALPVALAALGLLVILATVWMQRRFPSLVERVRRSENGGPKQLPAGWIAALGPVAIAATSLLFAMGEADERTAHREWRQTFTRRYSRLHEQPRAPVPRPVVR